MSEGRKQPTVTISARCTRAERSIVRAAAEHLGLTVSDFVLEATMAEARKRLREPLADTVR